MTQPDVINKLQRALVGGEQHHLDVIPATLARVIEQGIWKQCTDKKGQPFVSFEAFVKYPLWWGLERSIDALLHFCYERPEVQALIRKEIGALPAHGVNQHGGGNNITSSSDAERGTGSTYTLRRLKRDAPELAVRVASGEISANAAAIEAGFRRKTISVALEPIAFVNAIRKHFSIAQRSAIADAIQSMGSNS